MEENIVCKINLNDEELINLEESAKILVTILDFMEEKKFDYAYIRGEIYNKGFISSVSTLIEELSNCDVLYLNNDKDF